ncbi:MAG TPA: SGNH/GDSL hydrolase family protein [Pyrinomonadaceae bacterium]|nr:SGNH/GDSL hydrolase family protein [Pyrinomonadaceae bacterium]
MGDAFDTKPYIEYDAEIGYRYKPNTRQVLRKPGGGNYEIAINPAGIRSDREYSHRKPAGIFRMLVFGDSYVAGQFVSNNQRFSELLERRNENLEVINFGLEGTGTDQQLLLYERIGPNYEHDLVLLFPFLQNIRRNLVEAREGYDPKTGGRVVRHKPRFELAGVDLVLHNVPVPQNGQSTNTKLPDVTDSNTGVAGQLKARLSTIPGAYAVKKALYGVFPWEPFPEYRNSRTPAWQLMEAIIRRFKKGCGTVPLVIAPVFYDSYVLYRMARNYWSRFASLSAVPGVYVIDLLPHFKRIRPNAVRAFQRPHDCHFSEFGHVLLANVLEEELRKRGLLPDS